MRCRGVEGQGSAAVVNIGTGTSDVKGTHRPSSRSSNSTASSVIRIARGGLDAAPLPGRRNIPARSRSWGCRIQSGDRVCALSGNICPILDVGRSHARGPIRPVNTMPGSMNYPVNSPFPVSSHPSEQRALLPFPLLRPRPPRFWPPQPHPLRISPPHHRPARTFG